MKRLYRSRTSRYLAGVCGGIGEYFNIDPNIVRIVAVLLGFFEASDYMLEIGVPALRIISISFLLAGFCIISSSFFQALGHGVLSLIVSLVRQMVVLLPVAWLLSFSGQLELVWWAFPFAELFSLSLCIFFHRFVYRREIQPMLNA